MRGVTPNPILDRVDKRGTPGPLVKWFAGGLNDDLRTVLMDRRTRERGLFDSDRVDRAISDHRKNGSYGEQIWMMLCVELWHRTFIDTDDVTGPITL